MTPDVGLLTSILGIVVIDLVLSGDNAVVIGVAAHRLPPPQRRTAILVGGAGAIIARVTFTAITALLLTIPLLRAVGGVVLVWVAFKLLKEEEEEIEGVKVAASLAEAIRTVIIADVIMSLDNILAVGAAAHGDVWLLIFGLGLSMPLLMFGAGLVAAIVHRFPLLVYVGCAILAWVAARLIVEDPLVHAAIGGGPIVTYVVPALLTAATVGSAHWFHRHLPRQAINRRQVKS